MAPKMHPPREWRHWGGRCRPNHPDRNRRRRRRNRLIPECICFRRVLRIWLVIKVPLVERDRRSALRTAEGSVFARMGSEPKQRERREKLAGSLSWLRATTQSSRLLEHETSPLALASSKQGLCQ